MDMTKDLAIYIKTARISPDCTVNDYNDIRKNGSKLRKRVVMILKQLEKGRRMNED